MNYVIGQIYYMVWYDDDQKLYLAPDTLIFVGKNLENLTDNRDTWYFQDSHSYWHKGAFTAEERSSMSEPDGNVYCLHEEDLFQIVDMDGLRAELEECKRRWAGKK